jgi:hypothetical protein
MYSSYGPALDCQEEKSCRSEPAERSVYFAASIDGSGSWQSNWRLAC